MSSILRIREGCLLLNVALRVLTITLCMTGKGDKGDITGKKEMILLLAANEIIIHIENPFYVYRGRRVCVCIYIYIYTHIYTYI